VSRINAAAPRIKFHRRDSFHLTAMLNRALPVFRGTSGLR
jgi:hypothetical protein